MDSVQILSTVPQDEYIALGKAVFLEDVEFVQTSKRYWCRRALRQNFYAVAVLFIHSAPPFIVNLFKLHHKLYSRNN